MRALSYPISLRLTRTVVEGGLIYLQSLGKSIVMINSYDIAIELLEKRSLNYSDRPHSVMLNEL